MVHYLRSMCLPKDYVLRLLIISFRTYLMTVMQRTSIIHTINFSIRIFFTTMFVDGFILSLKIQNHKSIDNIFFQTEKTNKVIVCTKIRKTNDFARLTQPTNLKLKIPCFAFILFCCKLYRRGTTTRSCVQLYLYHT